MTKEGRVTRLEEAEQEKEQLLIRVPAGTKQRLNDMIEAIQSRRHGVRLSISQMVMTCIGYAAEHQDDL